MKRSRLFVSALCTLATLTLPHLPARAAEARQDHADIAITWDGEFDRAHGVRSGSGVPDDPYVIAGWNVGNLLIKDTDKAIRIVDNTISGTLTLDWVGKDIELRRNDIGDLRLNQNVARWGDPTAGVIARNTFGQVGQLRHFDGVFAYNTVGAPGSGPAGAPGPDVRAVNFDGFNGAHFEHNTIYGYVDARLHGHHHSSGFGMPSHMHAMSMHDGNMTDHTTRYHEGFIRWNTIMTSHPYALAYLDTNHAANDRTADSETNPMLNAPHVHYTRIHIVGNDLIGSGLLVDVFNARDERHEGTPHGRLEILRNEITLQRDPASIRQTANGVEVRQARYLRLKIHGTVVQAAAPLADVEQIRSLIEAGSGILLNVLDHATVTVKNTRVTDGRYGVRATQLAKSVDWTIANLETSGVLEPVSYDASVANPPQRP